MSDSEGAGGVSERCGIVGVVLSREHVALSLYYALYALQHRGQEAAGIAVSDHADAGVGGESVTLLKGIGLVSEVFSRQQIAALRGTMGIGHVQYSTRGATRVETTEPLLVTYRNGELAIGLNGSLVNATALRKELERDGRIFHSDSDTEVIAQLLAKDLMHHTPLEAVKELMRRVVGSYSLVILLDSSVLAVRDPLGIKPLCIGALKDESGTPTGYIVASESPAIDTLGGELLRDVHPGEVLLLSPPESPRSPGRARQKGMPFESHQLYRGINSAHCIFEYVYFARPDSVIDGKLVYDVRLRIGERLAEEHPVEADIISPVPDSGITYAIGYARCSGIDYMEGLIKNRYVGRTFIMPEQSTRDTAVRLKLNVVQANVAGKRVVLVDDSIVRGTTSRIIVDHLKKKGAREVHLRIGSPPIIAPCYLGIDTPTRDELVACGRTLEEIAAFLHADSVRYVSPEGLIEAVGIEVSNLCLGCASGNYPVEIPGEQCIARQLRLSHFT
ncbi:MAG: amidophosphoribosyltransferase [Methanomicrobia archaeon]|nr:amidophosphoribosyltransferase [Methanomicrobia archaeon]